MAEVPSCSTPPVVENKIRWTKQIEEEKRNSMSAEMKGLSELDSVEYSIPALYLFITTAGGHRSSSFNGRDLWARHSSLHDRFVCQY